MALVWWAWVLISLAILVGTIGICVIGYFVFLAATADSRQ